MEKHWVSKHSQTHLYSAFQKMYFKVHYVTFLHLQNVYN